MIVEPPLNGVLTTDRASTTPLDAHCIVSRPCAATPSQGTGGEGTQRVQRESNPREFPWISVNGGF